VARWSSDILTEGSIAAGSIADHAPSAQKSAAYQRAMALDQRAIAVRNATPLASTLLGRVPVPRHPQRARSGLTHKAETPKRSPAWGFYFGSCGAKHRSRPKKMPGAGLPGLIISAQTICKPTRSMPPHAQRQPDGLATRYHTQGAPAKKEAPATLEGAHGGGEEAGRESPPALRLRRPIGRASGASIRPGAQQRSPDGRPGLSLTLGGAQFGNPRALRSSAPIVKRSRRQYRHSAAPALRSKINRSPDWRR
jgi:hypothetical protein